MSVTIDGNAGVTFPAGGVGNTASATVGLTDTQTLTNKTLTSPTINSGTLSSPVISGTPTGVGVLTSGTAVASTSGTSIDFTGIPSWVKRITVMYQGVSTNSTSGWLVQIGSGSLTTTGYVSGSHTTSNADYSSTAGFIVLGASIAATNYSGSVSIMLAGTNSYACSGILSPPGAAGSACVVGGWITLGGTLDRVRITTVNGTDTFDAGSINILYE